MFERGKERAEINRLSDQLQDAFTEITRLRAELNDRREERSDQNKAASEAKWAACHGRDAELKHLQHAVNFEKQGNSDLRAINAQFNQRNIALKGKVDDLLDELVSLNNKLEEKEKEAQRLAGRLNREPGTSEPRMYRTDSGLQEKVDNMEVGIRTLHVTLDHRDSTIEKLQKHNVGLQEKVEYMGERMRFLHSALDHRDSTIEKLQKKAVDLLKQVQTPIYIVGPAAGEDVVASLRASTDREKDLSEKLQKEVNKRKDAEERLGYFRLDGLKAKKKVEALKRALVICRRLFINLRIEPGSGNFTQIWAEKGEGVADVALKD